MASPVDQPLTIEIFFGRMDTPDQEARARRLHAQLKEIVQGWDNYRPTPAFKFVLDPAGQVRIRMNQQMLGFMLARFSELDVVSLQSAAPDDPPEWFMNLMGGEPYQRPVDGGGI